MNIFSETEEVLLNQENLFLTLSKVELLSKTCFIPPERTVSNASFISGN